jgi:hypothetical protein
MTRPRQLTYALLAMLLLLFAQGTPAQDLALERSVVLRSFGTVDDPELNLFPLQPGPGTVFTQPVPYANAEFLRLNFVVLEESAVESSWHIQISQGDELVSQITPEDLASGSYWSDEFAGAKVTVELHSTSVENSIKLQIKYVAVGKTGPERLTIVGENQLSPIGVHASWVKKLGDSIARLRFVASDRNIYSCTAFLITKDLMMTNQHCISNQAELKSALVDFDYDTAISETFFTRLTKLVACDHALDYSIVRLRESPDREPLQFASVPVTNPQELIIIQHPGGEPKMVSIEDCDSSQANVVGRGNTKTDFLHTCDTETGSSGSPVMDRAARTVVGLHHLGYEEEDDILVNRAVHIEKVLQHLNSDLRAHVLDPGTNAAPGEEEIEGCNQEQD